MDRHDCGRRGWSHGREWRDSPPPGTYPIPALPARAAPSRKRKTHYRTPGERNRPFPGNSSASLSRASIPAANAVRLCSGRKTNSMPDAAGPVLRRPSGTHFQWRTPDSEESALLRQFPFPGIPGSPSSDSGGCPPLKARGREKYPAALPCAAGCGRRGGIYPEICSRPRSLSRQQGISLTRKILAVSRIRLSAQPVSPVPGNSGD